MILFSIVTMRDLIRNYKMIISGRNHDSDTETEPLMSSTSSSSHASFGTVREPAIFKQESYSTESELEASAQQKKPTKNSQTSPFSIQDPIKRQILYPTSFTTPEIDVFTKSEIMPVFSRTKTEDGLLASSKEYNLADDSYHSYTMFIDLEGPSTHNSLVTMCPLVGERQYTVYGDCSVHLVCLHIAYLSTVACAGFAIWNTTMGSSLLAMAWGLEKSGLIPGIVINILIAALCLYTAYILVSINAKHGILGHTLEVPDLCRMLIGRWAEILAKIFSLVVLIGANIVYWVLMSNFLYNFVLFVYEFFNEKETTFDNTSVICPKEIIKNISMANVFTESFNYVSVQSTFYKVWDLYSTVPIFLAVVMFPLLNFKSPTFFTKFNSMGTISAGYLLFFVAVKSMNWGLKIQDWSSELTLKPTFCALSGMLSLSYFIHNIIISILRHNKHQEHNGRDLSIAFGLITFTYIFIGVLFYASFPLAKSCIEDNILNNFSKRDAMTIIARILLLFQLFTVVPLISFMLRNDILAALNMVSKKCGLGDFSYGKVVIINSVMMFICIMFACFLPRIGTLIRYTGALSGLVYVFMLPSLLKMASLKKERALTCPKSIFYTSIVVLGVLNLVSQFFINDSK